MGRAFEFRKARKMKRWGAMAKTFTRIGKDIVMAVKEGGPDPASNSRLRALIQNAKAANMPKDNVERAIKKATSKDQADYKNIVYDGYGPHGIGMVIECATDNPTRTVANVRKYFTRSGGSLGTSGSLDFMFEHKSVFKVANENIPNLDDFELELIDQGAEEFGVDDNEIIIYGPFDAYGAIQKMIEDGGYNLISSEFERVPTDTKKLSAEQEEELDKLINEFLDDDDVQNVYHTMG